MSLSSLVIGILVVGAIILLLDRRTKSEYRPKSGEHIQRSFSHSSMPGSSQLTHTFTQETELKRAPIDPLSDAELIELLRAGKKIEAIKRYRELYGAGLADAKQAIEELFDSDLSRPASPETSPAANGNFSQDPEILAFMRQGNTIQAIKRYRELSGVGLKEAKDFIDQLDRELYRR